ncbi:hypothetical protein [Streptomyces nodosus]|uniref:hypothetical protein n=1 Tax=Streptomyces nodosus TaxID=40318 RepID=UPI000694AB05|nr:hypothetical protein [Streptomyces nodosus]MBB4793119.1 hypothetical protein [Streptomyces nodosus]
MRRLSTAVAAAGVCAALLLGVSGCSRQHYEERGKADAPVLGRAGEDSPAEAYNFPDGFGNLATKCVGDGKRGYATTSFVQSKDEDDVRILPANAVIVDDPSCRSR